MSEKAKTAEPAWLYAPGAPPTERLVRVIPGYSCGYRGETCEHDPKGDHGVHNDEVHLIVRTMPDGVFEEAIELRLFTKRRSGVIERRSGETHCAEGVDVRVHASYVYEDEAVRLHTTPTPCHNLRHGACYIGPETSVRSARDMWTVADDRALEAVLLLPDMALLTLGFTTGIWDRLRDRLLEEAKELRELHATLPKQCAACGGSGLIARHA